MNPEDIEIVLLRPDEVMVDRTHAVQRGLVDSHVKAIAKVYNPALFGLGHVSLREDGNYYLMDGQHRCMAAILAKRGADRVSFQVWRGLSIQQEAAKFRELNALKKSVSALDLFKTGVEAKNPTCVEVARILDSFGLSAGLGASEGTVSAVSALLQIYDGKIRAGVKKAATKNDRLPQSHLLTRTLTVLTTAWGRDRNAFDGILLKSVAGFIYKHDTKMEGSRLANLLAKNDSPARAIGKIKALKEAARVQVVAAGVQYLEGVYNRKLAEEKKLQ